MMFNDAGPSYVAFDQEKQAQAAILCSLLGAAFGSLAGTRSATARRTTRLPTHRLVMATVAALAQDPGIRLDDGWRYSNSDEMTPARKRSWPRRARF